MSHGRLQGKALVLSSVYIYIIVQRHKICTTNLMHLCSLLYADIVHFVYIIHFTLLKTDPVHNFNSTWRMGNNSKGIAVTLVA